MGAVVSEPVAAVLDAMLALIAAPADGSGVRAGTAPGLEGVQVFDGPPLGEVEVGDALALGLSIEDVSAASGEERPGWGGRRTESHVVAGLVQSSTGGVDVAVSRVRAYQLLDALRAVLVANLDLSGTCDWARLVRSTYRPVQTAGGCLVLIEFAIRVDATRFEGA
ncbi:MAG: hypothetical protein BGP03_33245 [Pseudonocardia sp. 73-21]|nr:MAG: hypothetical protein BGP03_33245 [Pseudonocardia sp. 73-21]